MRFSFLSLLFFFSYLGHSQTKEVNPPKNIKTIQLQELTSERQIPLIELGKTMTLSFDDIYPGRVMEFFAIENSRFFGSYVWLVLFFSYIFIVL